MENNTGWPELEELAGGSTEIEGAEEAGEAEEQAVKAGRVFIEIPKERVAMRMSSREQSFFTVQLPENVIIDGMDCSGWRFTQTKMFPSKYHGDMYVASFPREEWQITLTKPFRTKGGEWDREVRHVTAGELKEALAAARKAAGKD